MPYRVLSSTRTENRGDAEQALATCIHAKDRNDVVKGVGLTGSQAFNDYLVEYARPQRLASLALVEIAADHFSVHTDIDDPRGGDRHYRARGYADARRRRPSRSNRSSHRTRKRTGWGPSFWFDVWSDRALIEPVVR